MKMQSSSVRCWLSFVIRKTQKHRVTDVEGPQLDAQHDMLSGPYDPESWPRLDIANPAKAKRLSQ